MNKQCPKGFTLIELLIVVVILGIIAAIVIPQFSDAATTAKANTLKSNLSLIRSQLQLFKLDHNDTFPTLDQLTSTTLSPNFAGTYLAGNFPENPFNNKAAVENLWLDGTTAGDATEGIGWSYCPTDKSDGSIKAGTFKADDTSEHAGW